MSPLVTLSSGFSLRPALLAEADEVARLLMAHNIAEYGEPLLSPESLRARWQVLSLPTDTWLIRAPTGQLAGYAHAEYHTAGRFFLSVYVSPAFRAQGLGTHLLAQAEARARQGPPAQAGEAPFTQVRLSSRLSDRNPASHHVYEKAGFTRRLTFAIMEYVLPAQLPPPNWPSGVLVRAFVPGRDEQATYEVDEAASAEKGYHLPLTFGEWADHMGLGQARFDPSLWLLAWAGEQLIGVALQHYSATLQTGWLDHLGVLPGWRRRGVGGALLRQGWAAFQQRGARLARLSVDAQSRTGAVQLYERAGMQVVQHYYIYKKDVSVIPAGMETLP